MNIWLDDERVPPLGWVWLRRLSEVQKVLSERADEVDLLSLDHDLGMVDEERFNQYTEGVLSEEEAEETGYELCKWMAEHNIWPSGNPGMIYLHTDNPVGRDAMAATIEHYGPYRKHPDGTTFTRV